MDGMRKPKYEYEYVTLLPNGNFCTEKSTHQLPIYPETLRFTTYADMTEYQRKKRLKRGDVVLLKRGTRVLFTGEKIRPGAIGVVGAPFSVPSLPDCFISVDFGSGYIIENDISLEKIGEL